MRRRINFNKCFFAKLKAISTINTQQRRYLLFSNKKLQVAQTESHYLQV